MDKRENPRLSLTQTVKHQTVMSQDDLPDTVHTWRRIKCKYQHPCFGLVFATLSNLPGLKLEVHLPPSHNESPTGDVQMHKIFKMRKIRTINPNNPE